MIQRSSLRPDGEEKESTRGPCSPASVPECHSANQRHPACRVLAPPHPCPQLRAASNWLRQEIWSHPIHPFVPLTDSQTAKLRAPPNPTHRSHHPPASPQLFTTVSTCSAVPIPFVFFGIDSAVIWSARRVRHPYTPWLQRAPHRLALPTCPTSVTRLLRSEVLASPLWYVELATEMQQIIVPCRQIYRY